MITHSPEVTTLINQLNQFMDEHVYPNETVYKQQCAAAEARWTTPPIVAELKAKAKAQGLWNLFMPRGECDLPEHESATHGLSNYDYAPLCEVMGRVDFAPELFNCSAPDTGNMETLARYGTPAQQRQWLAPLLAGDIRSCFCMTEPDVASSDATNIETDIRRDGDHYVINGRKWWSTGAIHADCKIAIVMGRTDANAPRHQQQSMILVPLDTPGVTVERHLNVFGYDHAPHGHAEVTFENVSVSEANMLLGEGRGFEIAQGRLGPGRIHHCMRLIGAAERALELMCDRVNQRVAFGRPLADQGGIRQDIARSRCEIDQARLMTLHAAAKMDAVGNKAARGEIAMIKVIAPNMACRVIDRAIQAHGGAGVSQDTFLADAYAKSRSLRLADGPDEVHMNAIARMELARSKMRCAPSDV